MLICHVLEKVLSPPRITTHVENDTFRVGELLNHRIDVARFGSTKIDVVNCSAAIFFAFFNYVDNFALFGDGWPIGSCF